MSTSTNKIEQINDPETPGENAGDEAEFYAARRAKLDKLLQLGVDPWGNRFDDRSYIGDIRARAHEIKYQTEAGQTVDLPEFDSEKEFDFRAWKSEQGKGELVGPSVRAAGRIRLQRDK